MQRKDKECKICGLKFFTGAQVTKHMLIHTGLRYNCFVPGCKTSLTRRDNLVTHMKRSHQLTQMEQREFKAKLASYDESVHLKMQKWPLESLKESDNLHFEIIQQ